MPRRALPAGVFSSSPSRLRCLAVLTAAWGSHGFRSISSVNGGTRVRAATAATNEVGEVQVEERPWLGNGPDPMASTGKIRPGTSASLGAAAAAAVVGEKGGKGKGVAAEEMWLNGPFNAPVPPGPLVSYDPGIGYPVDDGSALPRVSLLSPTDRATISRRWPCCRLQHGSVKNAACLSPTDPRKTLHTATCTAIMRSRFTC